MTLGEHYYILMRTVSSQDEQISSEQSVPSLFKVCKTLNQVHFNVKSQDKLK